MAIRELIEADAEAYRDLRLHGLRESPEAFGSTFAEEAARPLAFWVDRLRTNAASADRATLGAFDGEADGAALVGTVTLLRQDGAKDRHKAEVVGMVVAPQARRRGLGRALIEAAIARARAMDGVEQAHLAVVVGNPAARALYVACGFVPYGVEPHALKQGDAYWDEELFVLRLPT